VECNKKITKGPLSDPKETDQRGKMGGRLNGYRGRERKKRGGNQSENNDRKEARRENQLFGGRR